MISKITAIIMAIVTAVTNLSGFMPQKQTVYYDVSYGNHERQIMDVAFPNVNVDEGGTTNIGAVVYIHGGGWISGDKKKCENKMKDTTEALGVISATINYRYTSKTVNIIDILNDIDLALKKIKSMAETRGIKCEKVILGGASAGAHLSTLYAYAKKNSAPMEPVGAFAYCNPADLTNRNFIFNNSLAGPAVMLEAMSYLTGQNINVLNFETQKKYLEKISPITYVNGNSCPTLIVHGAKDDVVPISVAKALLSKLNSYKVRTVYIEYPESGHQLGTDPYLGNKCNQAIIDFVNTYLK